MKALITALVATLGLSACSTNQFGLIDENHVFEPTPGFGYLYGTIRQPRNGKTFAFVCLDERDDVDGSYCGRLAPSGNMFAKTNILHDPKYPEEEHAIFLLKMPVGTYQLDWWTIILDPSVATPTNELIPIEVNVNEDRFLYLGSFQFDFDIGSNIFGNRLNNVNVAIHSRYEEDTERLKSHFRLIPEGRFRPADVPEGPWEQGDVPVRHSPVFIPVYF